MHDFWVPFGGDVLERNRIDDRETNEEDVGVRIGEGSKAIVFFLSCCVPQTEFDGLVSGSEINDVVVKNGRDVIFGKFVVRITDEETGFADRTITDDDQFDHSCCHFWGFCLQKIGENYISREKSIYIQKGSLKLNDSLGYFFG